MKCTVSAFYEHLARHAEENRLAAIDGRAWMLPTTAEEMWAVYPWDGETMPTTWAAWTREELGRTVAHAALLFTSHHRAQLVVAVEHGYQWKGIGRTLARDALRHAADVGLAWVDGLAMARNEGVLRFDERLGFERLCVVPDHTRLMGHSYDVVMLTRKVTR